MTIKFILMVNKQGQTRLAQSVHTLDDVTYIRARGYYDYLTIAEKSSLEGEIIRKCLARSEQQCSFLEYRNYKCIYRRYASLFFIVGVDSEENELAVLEFIHNLVETLDKYFENVCELDIMFNIERAHFILDEMMMNGKIVETNKKHILRPLRLMDAHKEEA